MAELRMRKGINILFMLCYCTFKMAAVYWSMEIVIIFLFNWFVLTDKQKKLILYNVKLPNGKRGVNLLKPARLYYVTTHLFAYH